MSSIRGNRNDSVGADNNLGGFNTVSYRGDKMINDAEKQPKNSHLKQYEFKPGESGNPGGRPAGKSITAELRKLIDEGTNAEDMAKILYAMAKRMSPSQLSALRELMDRTDGKVIDKHEIETGDISIVYKQVDKLKE